MQDGTFLRVVVSLFRHDDERRDLFDKKQTFNAYFLPCIPCSLPFYFPLKS